MTHAQDSGARPAQGGRQECDEQLALLQGRLDAAHSTRDRVQDLMEVVMSVGRDLELEHVLRHVVKAATALVRARYGALGVIGPDHEKLVQFLTVGVDDAEAAVIGSSPSGHGILGELVAHPEPLRLAKLSEHASSYGFPAGHPPMSTFLGVPIRIRGQVFGNLYLTEKLGGAQFDAEDESILTTLAVAAGVAIDNARLYERSQQRELWLQATAEVTQSLLSGSERAVVLALIADRAREIAGADLVVVALPAADRDSLVVELADGLEADRYRALRLAVSSGLIGTAFTRAVPVTGEDMDDPGPAAYLGGPTGLGPGVAIPIGTGAGVRGVLLLVRASGRAPFLAEEIRPVLGFAGTAAVAMELAERRSDTEQIVLLEERDRIARDLHDLAIQRLFATGMTLQSAGRFIDHPEASERVERAVDDLDATIKIIRSTIFGLRTQVEGEGERLRARTVRAVAVAAASLGFSPGLRKEGLLDTQVSRFVADHLLAVLGESLANVVRHARASRVEVTLRTNGREVTLTVADDGVGIEGSGRHSGLRNLSDRAERCGGTMELSSPPGGGTRLVWRVPAAGP
ncbi:GAF domain-containing sensor histidine kinase [Streptomyces uncialis]|uniref:GAF domain-containing sensor histidine kinase n=1 Tax=Streptomyces uncialis TaxID=1048205 RepID=UPI002E33AC47|nr:GAF domain-containing protein [Streptomyces uncialis]